MQLNEVWEWFGFFIFGLAYLIFGISLKEYNTPCLHLEFVKNEVLL